MITFNYFIEIVNFFEQEFRLEDGNIYVAEAIRCAITALYPTTNPGTDLVGDL